MINLSDMTDVFFTEIAEGISTMDADSMFIASILQ